MSNPRFRIEDAVRAASQLDGVKVLWRANKATLGFFPDGAFREYASRRWMLLAVEPTGGRVVGYLIYRVADQRATIVHLCVSAARRGQGIARALVDRLVERTRDLSGIGLRCRRDYSAAQVWPRFGFVARDDVRGRGHDGGELTYWWRDHDHPTLFSAPPLGPAADRLQVVIDANVFIDIFDLSQQGPEAEESRALQADWLSDVDLCVTDELFNEISRIVDRDRREEARRWADRLPKADFSHPEYQRVLAEMRSVFPPNLSAADESDLRHLCQAIAAKVSFFVTRDAELLRMADDLYARYQVSVLRPADLVVHIDEMLRTPEYQPSRLAGTLLRAARATSRAGDDLIRAFHAPGSGELQVRFAASLRSYLADPHSHVCSVVTDEAGSPLGLVVTTLAHSSVHEVPILRLAQAPAAPTLARHLAFWLARDASRLGKAIIRVTDGFLAHDLQGALRSEGFTDGPAGWVKLAVNQVCSSSELRAYLAGIADRVPPGYPGLRSLPAAIARLDVLQDRQSLAQLERLLWPLRISDAGIPSFLVSIRPAWAQHLFDEALARQTLFGAESDLALRRECVYYRARRPDCGLSAPGRILWYVTQSRRLDGTGAIRACSSLDEVVVGSASEMYKRYRRYGVYGWPEVRRLARGDADREIMVLRFSGTELFTSPVGWTGRAAELVGREVPPQSPMRIHPSAFAALCSAGRRCQEGRI